jgi:hypothetical protein
MNKQSTPLSTYLVLTGLFLLFSAYMLYTWWRFHGTHGPAITVQVLTTEKRYKGPDEITVQYRQHTYKLPVTRKALNALEAGHDYPLHYDEHKDVVFDPAFGAGRYMTGFIVSLLLAAACLYMYFRIRRRRYLEAHRVRRFYRS